MPRRLPITTAEYRQFEPEAAFQSWVMDYARTHSWLVAHINDSRRQDADGVPDLIMARAGVVLLAECKSETGSVRPAQKPWLAASGDHLWRPSMRDVVIEVLT